jgi:hypothetical protein
MHCTDVPPHPLKILFLKEFWVLKALPLLVNAFRTSPEPVGAVEKSQNKFSHRVAMAFNSVYDDVNVIVAFAEDVPRPWPPLHTPIIAVPLGGCDGGA